MIAEARYRQSALLRLALTERGRSDAFRIDHMHACATVGDQRVGIVYPDSFFGRTAHLVDLLRTRRFTFRGHLSRGRTKLLRQFAARHGHVCITPSRAGRDERLKSAFDPGYFLDLASAEFGLCPDHMTWPGPVDGLWTYRFVECCMVGTIPVQFRVTPLGSFFTDGFHYVWDDDSAFVYDRDAALHNRALAEQRWRLP